MDYADQLSEMNSIITRTAWEVCVIGAADKGNAWWHSKRLSAIVGRQRSQTPSRGLRRWHLWSLGGLIRRLCSFDDGPEQLLPVADDAIAGITENIGVAVFVDGDDTLGT
jgi:hypothetical protein